MGKVGLTSLMAADRYARELQDNAAAAQAAAAMDDDGEAEVAAVVQPEHDRPPPRRQPPSQARKGRPPKAPLVPPAVGHQAKRFAGGKRSMAEMVDDEQEDYPPEENEAEGDGEERPRPRTTLAGLDPDELRQLMAEVTETKRELREAVEKRKHEAEEMAQKIAASEQMRRDAADRERKAAQMMREARMHSERYSVFRKLLGDHDVGGRRRGYWS